MGTWVTFFSLYIPSGPSYGDEVGKSSVHYWGGPLIINNNAIIIKFQLHHFGSALIRFKSIYFLCSGTMYEKYRKSILPVDTVIVPVTEQITGPLPDIAAIPLLHSPKKCYQYNIKFGSSHQNSPLAGWVRWDCYRGSTNLRHDQGLQTTFNTKKGVFLYQRRLCACRGPVECLYSGHNMSEGCRLHNSCIWWKFGTKIYPLN